MKINKTFKLEGISSDEDSGVVEAYVNTMGIPDKDNDIIAPDAFDKSIVNNLPIPVLSGHDQASLVGKVITARAEPITTDEYQLYAKMQMNMETQSGRAAFSNIAGDFVREWSVGFNIPDPEKDIEYVTVEKETIRKINNLDWVEVSAVIRGASPMTATISAKQEPNERSVPTQLDETASDTTFVASDTESLEKQIEVTRLRLKLNNKTEE